MGLFADILLSAAAHQLLVNGKEQIDRVSKYNQARWAAGERGKQLLVVGGPWGTSSIRRVTGAPAHPPGDT